MRLRKRMPGVCVDHMTARREREENEELLLEKFA